MPNEAKLKQMLQDLSAAFPEEAVERSDGRVTGRGYSTTGIKVAFIVMRLNLVVGLGGWRLHREITVREISNSSGRRGWEAVADVVLELVEWNNGTAVTYAEAIADGGHVSYSSEADARKGATSNGLKKAASMFGCGWQAFAGTLDDDNLPGDQASAPPMTTVVRAPAPVRAVATPHAAPPRAQSQDRGRISSKQVAAIMSISRKLGTDPAALRSRVKTQFNCQLEFLSREQASLVISSLQAQLNANGSGQHHADPPGESLAS